MFVASRIGIVGISLVLTSTCAIRTRSPIQPDGGGSGDDGGWHSVDKKKRKPPAPRYTRGPRNWYSIMTWNVENMGQRADERHKAYVNTALEQLLEDHRPDIIVLQEVENCNLVQRGYKDFGYYRCVGSVVPSHVESRLNFVVLGNVLIYREDLFVASKPNHVLRRGYEHAAHVRDKNGKTLLQHHSNLCSRWAEYNGCRDAYADMPDATSVDLMFKPNSVWKSSMATTFPGGVRVVNVHLFSGGRQDISNSTRHERRAFQLRSLFHLVHAWNKNQSGVPPTTLYAGDYNTRGDDELGLLAKSSVDYGVDMWCPVDNGLCSRVQAKKKTHRAGFLDNVAMDVQPPRSRARLGAWGLVLDQPPGSRSDHNPLLLKMESPEIQKPEKNDVQEPVRTTTTKTSIRATTTTTTETETTKKKRRRRRRRNKKGDAPEKEVEDLEDSDEEDVDVETGEKWFDAQTEPENVENDLDEVDLDEPISTWIWFTSPIASLYNWLSFVNIEKEEVLLSDGQMDDGLASDVHFDFTNG